MISLATCHMHAFMTMQDLFTEEAYRGMLEIVKYARYVEGQQQLEEDPGKDIGTAARMTRMTSWTMSNDRSNQ